MSHVQLSSPATRLVGWLFACLAALPLFALAPASRAATGSGEANLPEDSRLAKRVTLKLKKTPLSEVAAELSRQTGATLRTSAEVADEPAVVWITEQPAQVVMRQLAELFDYRWTRTVRAGEYRYELYQDLKGKRQEEALRQQDRKRALEALHVDLQKRAERLREHPDASQEADLLVVSSLTANHWNAMANGQMLHFSTNARPGVLPLSPALASKLVQLQESRNSNPDPMPIDTVDVRLWLNFQPTEVILQSSREFRQGQGRRSRGGLVGSGNPQLRRGTEPVEPEKVAKWQKDPLLSAIRPFQVDPRKAAPQKRPGPSGITFLRLYEILPEIAETYGIDLVADAYWAQRTWRQPPVTPKEMPLYEVLQQYVSGVADWTRDQGTVRVRSRNWYQDRLGEVPERVIRNASAELRQQRRTTLEGEAALALTLRDEQWAHFLDGLQNEGVYLHEESHRGTEGSWEVLRAYGSLTPTQQKSLRSGGELEVTRLPLAARRWLLASLEQRRRSFSLTDLPFVELRPGVLTLSATTIQREVTSSGPEEVRSVLRVLDGPDAGKQLGTKTSGGSLRPGLSEGGQVFQQVVLRYRSGDQQMVTFDVELPWVYVDPSVKRPATEEPEVPAK